MYLYCRKSILKLVKSSLHQNLVNITSHDCPNLKSAELLINIFVVAQKKLTQFFFSIGKVPPQHDGSHPHQLTLEETTPISSTVSHLTVPPNQNHVFQRRNSNNDTNMSVAQRALKILVGCRQS